jgi:hypothetical protein
MRSSSKYRDRGDRSRSAGCFLRALLLLVLLVVVAALVGAFWTGASPKVAVDPKLPGIGRRTPIQIKIEDPQRVTKVRVELVQGENDPKPIAEKDFAPRPAWEFWSSPAPAEMTVEVGRETVQGLRTGPATVRVTAERAGTWLRKPDPVVSEVQLPVRLSPPTLGVLSSFHFANQGGSETVVYRVGDGAVRDGVQAGKWWFPGFPMPGGDKQQRFALFAVPYDLDDPSGVRLVAVDDVGNRAEVAFLDKFTPRPIRTDTIDVNDPFLNRVVPEIMAQSPEVEDQGDLLKNYLAINRNLRRQNAETLKEMAAKSPQKFLWNEPFIPMPNASITAAFADRRTYVYNGQAIDQQDHLGFDMASVERDVIPSSNAGKVVSDEPLRAPLVDRRAGGG